MADNVQKIISVELKAGQAINGIAQLNQLIQNEKDLMKQLTAENKKGSEQYAMAEKSVKELNCTKRQLHRRPCYRIWCLPQNHHCCKRQCRQHIIGSS